MVVKGNYIHIHMHKDYNCMDTGKDVVVVDMDKASIVGTSHGQRAVVPKCRYSFGRSYF